MPEWSEVTRAGLYRAKITDSNYKAKVGDNYRPITIDLRAQLLMRFDDVRQEWEDIAKERFYADGRLWLVSQDGNNNTAVRDALINHGGWDDNVLSLISKTWQPLLCSVEIEANEYKGKTRYKVVSLQSWEKVVFNADVIAEINNRYGFKGKGTTTARPHYDFPEFEPPPSSTPAPAAVSTGEEEIPF